MHQIITTALDLAGFLLIVAGIAWAVSYWSPAAALPAAGVALLAVSWLIDHRQGAGS